MSVKSKDHDNKTCLELAQEGERLCRQKNYHQGITFFQSAIQAGTDDLSVLSVIYSQLGNAYFYLGNYQRAIQYHKLDLVLTRFLKDKEGEAKSINNIGTTLKSLGQYEEAVTWFENFLHISRELNDKVGEGKAFYNLANAFYSQGKEYVKSDSGVHPAEVRRWLEKAIEYYKENLVVLSELGDEAGRGQTLGNIGNVHHLLGNYHEAIRYQNERLSIAVLMSNKVAERRAHTNLGNAYVFVEQFEKAAYHYGQSLALAQQLEDRVLQAHACYSLGNTYTQMEDYHSAIEFHMKHLAIVQLLNDRVGEGRACWSLSNIYHQMSNHEKAFYFANLHLQISKDLADRAGQMSAEEMIRSSRNALNAVQKCRDSKVGDEALNDQKEDRTKIPTGNNSADIVPTRQQKKSNKDDDLFEWIQKFQSKRMDEQRATLPHLPGFERK